MPEKRKHVQEFLLPLLGVIGTSLVALFTLFWLMVTQQNQLSENRERAQLEAAVQAKVEFLSNNLRDYAMWTDSVENLAVELDTDWANDNIGPYMFHTKGYEYTFVLGPAGETLYASHQSAQTNDQAQAVLGPAFKVTMDRLLQAPDGREERFASVVEIEGRPAIMAAATILPNIGETYGKPFPRRYMVVVQPMDTAFVAELGKSYDIAGLAIRGGAAPEEGAALSLRTFGGKPIGHLQWTSSRPGDSVFADYLPWILLITAQAVLLSFTIMRRASRLNADLAASEAAAWHMATHDTLTALPNRRALRERGIRQPPNVPLAMLYLDLDGFKKVNDQFGHQAGDVLLTEATERLHAIVGDRAMLSRVGGDEFAVLVTSENSHELAVELADAIVRSMAKPFDSNEIRMVVSASVGVALGEPGQAIHELYRFADVAMYAAKAEGKNQWRIYSAEMDEGREVRKLLESELRDAVDAGEVEVLFQPIVDARQGTITSVEALARWTSPTQGPVGPAIFVPIAEESGLIVKLGELVLRKACIAARDWDVTLSVNVSPAQFWDRSLLDDILAILEECQFPAERLELEITEGYLLSRPDIAAQVIQQIRSHGIRVVLEDFGTGFASIGFLRRFELDRLKLDRSFVEFIDRNRESAEVAKAVIGLGQALNLPITAEGVENDPQALLLTLAGCERLQGWHYGRAAPASEIAFMIGQAAEAEQEAANLSLAG